MFMWIYVYVYIWSYIFFYFKCICPHNVPSCSKHTLTHTPTCYTVSLCNHHCISITTNLMQVQWEYWIYWLSCLRLHYIFALHDSQCVRLGNHYAINFCVLVGRLAPLQVWPRLIIAHVLACRQGEGLRNCQSCLQKERQETLYRSCQTGWENTEVLTS